MKKIIASILLLTILLLTSCSEDTASTKIGNISLLTEEGEAAFCIVTPENKTIKESQAGSDLRFSLIASTGARFAVTSDKLKSSETLESVALEKEILIGATNRQESIETLEELDDNEYAIRVVGEKIVIVGSNDVMTYKAMQLFLDMVTEANGFALPKSTNIKEKVEYTPRLIALTNQGNSRLEVYDISESTLDKSSLVWEYRLPHENIAGAKLRHSETYGDVALAVCGSSSGYMISYPEGKLLWSTDSAANNPHSIELMPNGVIAIASSDGDEVRFFTSSGEKPVAAKSLENAHGVLWDEKNQVLWAVGGNVLAAYKVVLNADGSVSVTEDANRCITIPDHSAHDLAPVYGNADELWITCDSKVFRFNKTSRKFYTDYPGNGILNSAYVQGIGSFDDGSIVFIRADGEYRHWTGSSIVFLKYSEGVMHSEVLKSPTGHFYKVRVWDSRYQ